MLSRFASFPLQKNILQCAPGILVCAFLAVAAGYIATFGGSGVLWALVAGIAIASFWQPSPAFADGIEFCGKHVLRLGVAMLGFQISASALQVLDVATIGALAAAVLIILAIGYAAGPLLGIDRYLALVLAASVAICGAAAAAAFAVAVPREQVSKRDLGCTIGIVSLLSLAAMLAYPPLASLLRLDAFETGVLLGASIHEVVHAVGAGYSVDTTTGDVATVTKLMRVALLAPALMLVVVACGEKAKAAPIARPPLFLVAFVAFAAANVAGLVPHAFAGIAAPTSRFCLLMAMAAIGLMLPWRSVFSYGWRPVALLLLLSAILFVLMAAFVSRMSL
jgi:uncharacterized integral membrane protein (TIGR00698 family)